MSQLADSGAVALANITERLATATIKQTATDTSEAVLIGLAGAIPLVMTVAGLLSKKFADSGNGVHPASCGSSDGILLASLLLARSASPALTPQGAGVGIDLSPELYADALADFSKLKPCVAVATFVRSDLLTIARDNHGVDGGELLAGILSKRFN